MKRLEAGATPGPWRIGHINEHLDRGEIENHAGVIIASDCKRNDESFVCQSRNSMPALLRVVEAAKRLSTAWQNTKDMHKDSFMLQIFKDEPTPLDPDFRFSDSLGLNEALRELEGE